jgi:GH25 family lysozyme M1 (1,4-beta-N-acetylmuramidase)
MPLGLDLSAWQGISGANKAPQPQPLTTFQRLARHGKDFVLVKASQSTPDPTFGGHYENVRAAGLIRGAFHWFTPRPVSDQVRLFLGLVPRVGPGDLAPALDLEDSSMALWQHYKYTHGKTGNAAGSTALLDDVQDWLDRVEAALGRIPIIYTGVIWRDDLKSTRMSQYPLWTLPSRWFPAGGLGGWRRVELWQYAEDGKPGHGMTEYREAGVELPGVDYDAYNGTIYGLRGLADLGRTGVGLTPLGAVAAHCEPDRHLHLMRESPPRTWTDTDLMRGALPGLGGDPVLCTAGTTVRLYFRSDGRVVEATQADPAATWDVEDLSSIAGVTAVHDARVLAVGDRRVVVFSGADDDWQLLSRTASTPWTATRLLSAARRAGTTSVPPSSGQPAVYLPPGSADPRVVGRAGPMGHLVELALEPAGWAATDLTATSTGPHGIPPAATYSPTVYHSDAETFIVYRAVRGELWQIARNARQATNLTGVPGVEPAVGHPTCFVLAGQVHVIYRGIDQGIHELTLRNGSWIAARLPCDVPAASDPTCTADTSTSLVAFRAMDGMVHVLRFNGSSWTCADTVRPAVPAGAAPDLPPAPAPPAVGSALFATLGTSAGRFRDLVAAGDEHSAVSLAYQHHQRDPNAITDLVFFARHRELGERRLRPDETALVQEWRTIRERVVGPAANALAQNDSAARSFAEHSEAGLGAVEPDSPGGSWLRAVTAAKAGFGEASDTLPGEGIGDVVKAVGDVATGAVDVLTREVAAVFDKFIGRLDELERMAIHDGYTTLTQRVTAFRKVFYGSFNPCGVPAQAGRSPYPGVPGGGAWDILIPGAAATQLPPTWTAPAGAEKVTALCNGSWQFIDGVPVHVGHVFAGLDARNYPTRVTLSLLGLPLVQMRSNLEAATFTGDLGSVVVDYVHGSNRSFRDTAMDPDPALLAATYTKNAGPDMTGNADAHLVVLNPSRTVVQNLRDYYTAPVGGWHRRWQGFVVSIGLGSFTPVPLAMPEPYRSRIVGTFSGLTEQWRSDMQGEIMAAALAYAAAKGHRSDVVAVLADQKPGIVTPTFWEMYWNVSGWVLDEFFHQLKSAVAAES